MEFFLFNSQDTFGTDSIQNEINSFQFLPIGWNYGEGFPPKIQTIAKAISISRDLNVFTNFKFFTSVTPTTNGGIALTFDLDENFIDIILNDDNSIDLKHEKGVGVDYEIISSITNVSVEIIKEKLWNLLEHCTSDCIATENNDFTQFLETMVAGYQSLIPPVQSEPAVPFVRTFVTSTMPSLVSQ